VKPATRPPDRRDDVRLLVVDRRTGRFTDARFADLPAQLGPTDLLVVNDAATLPASIRVSGPRGAVLEIRLLGPTDGRRWRAVVLGAGDWRTPTEHRPAPEPLSVGDVLTLPGGLPATVAAVSPVSPRLVELSFDLEEQDLWAAIYAAGRPVQYAYLTEDLALWSVQTVYAGRPWAAEMPSAGRAFTWELLLALRRRGVRVAALTHAAGLSSTGDPAIDAALPLPERYDIPAATVEAIERTRATGGRVIAIGTTVVRALEGNAATHGRLRAGTDETDLVIGPGHRLRVVDGVVTGMHEPSESHYRLLMAFVDEPLLRAAVDHARALGYRGHELGDATLVT